MKKYTHNEIKYDYSLALLIDESTETLLGGTRKALNKALKNDDFNVKGLTVFYRDKELAARRRRLRGLRENEKRRDTQLRD